MQKCDDEAVHGKGMCDRGFKEIGQVRMGAKNEWDTEQSGRNYYE